MNIWVTIILCGFLNCAINTIYLVKAKNIVKRKFEKIKDGKENEKEINDNVKLYADKKLEVAINTYILIFFCVLLYSYLSKSFKILDICNFILSIIYIRKLLEILFGKEKKLKGEDIYLLSLLPLFVCAISIVILDFIGSVYKEEIECVYYLINYFFVCFLIIMELSIFIYIIKGMTKITKINKKGRSKTKRIEGKIIEKFKLNDMLKYLLILLLLPIKQIWIIIKIFLKKVTGNYSINIVIKKTFYLCSIISILLTYHHVYYFKNQEIIKFYEIIATAIIIPMIMQIFSSIEEEVRSTNKN